MKWTRRLKRRGGFLALATAQGDQLEAITKVTSPDLRALGNRAMQWVYQHPMRIVTRHSAGGAFARLFDAGIL